MKGFPMDPHCESRDARQEVILNRVVSGCVEAIGRRVVQFWKEGRRVFEDCAIVNIALDATRMGGRDTLYTAMYSPDLKRAVWCPPQVAW